MDFQELFDTNEKCKNDPSLCHLFNMQFMRQYVESTGFESLNVEQRNLLSVAYKNIMGTKRTVWRVLTSMRNKANDEDVLMRDYCHLIVEELKHVISEVVVRETS